MKEYLTFDDVNIKPKKSDIESRSHVNTTGLITKSLKRVTPIISAPMDTVSGFGMATRLDALGAVACVHRFMPLKEQVLFYREFRDSTTIEEPDYSDTLEMLPPAKSGTVVMSIGVTGDWFERFIELSKEGCAYFCLDVAHGHHILVQRALDKIKSGDYACEIIAGNIATEEAAHDLITWGADSLRVGIGGGSLCETRIRTGVGVPMITCLQEVSNVAKDFDIPVIADGGIRQVGDIGKALAAGASSVMLGSLLAGTKESPGQVLSEGIFPNETKYKVYRGSASSDAKVARGESGHVEGNTAKIPYKGKVERIIAAVDDGIKSSFSYTGSRNLEEFHRNAEFLRITPAGMVEAHPHLLK